MKDLLAYLFGDSQQESEAEETRAAVERILEQAEEQEPLSVKRTPLINALKALKLGDVSDQVEYDPEGFSLVLADEGEHRRAVQLLMSPDAMEKLAQLGWVVTRCGDVAMTNEPAEFRIRFLEITDSSEDGEGNSWPAPNPELMKKIIKQGREFMDEPGPHDTDGPMDYADHSSDDNQKGIGKAEPGKNPEGKPKGSTGKTEAQALVDEVMAVNEAGHKAGCQCGFCKNKGSFGKKKKDGGETEPNPDESESSPDETVESVEPPRYDDVRKVTESNRRKGSQRRPRR